jgi:hypothetical protein
MVGAFQYTACQNLRGTPFQEACLSKTACVSLSTSHGSRNSSESKFLTPECFEHFGGGDDLADVALGVVGYVDERTADGGG